MAPVPLEEQRRNAVTELEAELTAWRQQHPTATLQEIEQALDTRLAQVRVELLNEVAQASTAADRRQAPSAEHPVCPECGIALQPRGKHERQIKTQGDQPVTLTRQYGVCPGCGTGLFPPG